MIMNQGERVIRAVKSKEPDKIDLYMKV